jgi:hypothetical protein
MNMLDVQFSSMLPFLHLWIFHSLNGYISCARDLLTKGRNVGRRRVGLDWRNIGHGIEQFWAARGTPLSSLELVNSHLPCYFIRLRPARTALYSRHREKKINGMTEYQGYWYRTVELIVIVKRLKG